MAENQSDNTDGLGDDIALANAGVKQKQTLNSGEKDKTPDHHLEINETPMTPAKKAKTETENDNKDRENTKKQDETSKKSSCYSLNSRRSKDEEPEDKQNEIRDLDSDVDTAVHAGYFTDDIHQDSDKEDDNTQAEGKSDDNKMHWEDDKSKDSKNRSISARSKESEVSKSIDNESKKDESDDEKPHLVTKYKKPEQVTPAPEEKPKQETEQPTKKSDPKPVVKTPKEDTRLTNRRQLSQSARYPSRGYQSTRDKRPTSSRATSQTTRSTPSRPRTTLGFSTGDYNTIF